MASLPTPGDDNDIWGDKLNTFLEVAHDTDGTLIPLVDANIDPAASIDPSKLAIPGDVTVVLLGDGTFGPPPPPTVPVTNATNVNIVSGTYTAQLTDGNGVVAVNSSSATTVVIPDATA